MNGRKAKRFRRAAVYLSPSHGQAQYAPPELHHPTGVPTYETYTRTIRAWNPALRKIVSTEVEKIRYQLDGKTPAKLVVNKDGTPQLTLVPVWKPTRLIKDSPRAKYQELKGVA